MDTVLYIYIYSDVIPLMDNMLLFCLYIGVHGNNILQQWKWFKDAHGWRYGKSQEESPEAFI